MNRYYASPRSATDDDCHSLLRQLRLRAQSPRCEGTTAKADRCGYRARARQRRRVRDHGRWRAEVLQAGGRPFSDRCGDRRAGERL